MTKSSTTILLVLATLLAGLIAGFFYTWSFTIMQSLNLVGNESSSAAMISINANIRTGWFAAISFGAPVAILLATLILRRTKNRAYIWSLIALIFAVSTLVITFTQHLPLNDRLAEGMDWNAYYIDWVGWNHVRMITSVVAFLMMLGSVLSFNTERIGL